MSPPPAILVKANFLSKDFSDQFIQFMEERRKIDELLENNRLTQNISQEKNSRPIQNQETLGFESQELGPFIQDQEEKMVSIQGEVTIQQPLFIPKTIKQIEKEQEIKRKRYIDNYFQRLNSFGEPIDRQEQQFVEKLLQKER